MPGRVEPELHPHRAQAAWLLGDRDNSQLSELEEEGAGHVGVRGPASHIHPTGEELGRERRQSEHLHGGKMLPERR